MPIKYTDHVALNADELSRDHSVFHLLVGLITNFFDSIFEIISNEPVLKLLNLGCLFEIVEVRMIGDFIVSE